MIKQLFNNIKKLNTKLLICTLTPMIVILLFAAGTSIRAITNTMTQLSMQQLRTEAASSCDRLTSYLSKYMVTVSSESSSYILERYMKTLTFGNNPKTNPYYYQLLDSLDNIYSVDTDNINMVWIADFDSGIGIGNTSTNFLKSGTQWNLASQPWYDQALASKEAFISDPYISLLDEEAIVSVIVPIQDSITQRTLGILALDLRVNAIRNVVESTSADSDAIIMVLDSQNHVVSHPDKSQLLQPAPTADGEVDRLGNSEENTIYGLFQFEKNNKNYLGYSVGVQDSSWLMIAFLERSHVIQDILPLLLQIVAIFILSILLFVLITPTVSKMVTHPLESITNATKELAKGNYTIQLQATSKDEVGQLAEAVNSTIQTLHKRSILDPLTGIYNEYAFLAKAEKLIEENVNEQYIFIRFDISRFKMVNDLFGSAMGDRLLCFIGSVLRDHVSPKDAYGRLGSDIFLVCLKETSEDALLDLIHRITYHLEAFPINFNLTPYFGICRAMPGVSLTTLLDWSNLALNTIKGSSLTNYAFYSDEMREQLLRESSIENEMVSALESGQFTIFLQPKCDIGSGHTIGAETLVRWIRPDGSMVRPDHFIPLFERNGFIIRLDEYVWEETCKVLHRWQEKGYPLIPISINVSRVHIFDPGFCDKITALVHKYNIPVQMLELEFTESAFISNVDELHQIMNTLRERGFTLSMDDFGSGYSSLNMLKNSPFDVIKIDREFLSESSSTENGRIIMRNTIYMLRQLKMKIVAEGVETKEQAMFLLHSGCSIAQGYYYSKPIDVSSFEEFVKFTQK